MTPSRTKPRGWLLLIHTAPAQPLYLRAKVRRLLEQAGGIALKRSVYALPSRTDCREEFERVVREATEGGGHAYICQARFLDPRTDATLIESSRSAREDDYKALGEVLGDLNAASDPESLARARERFRDIERIDFFEAPGRRRVEALLTRLEEGTAKKPGGSRRRDGVSGLVGRVWATRRGIQIDRIASAWLIRRSIDPSARFRFIDPTEPRDPTALHFDMVGGDFTHEEDRCTFETLVRRISPSDPALSSVAEIVHDVDIKDGKFGRPEARGVEQLLFGLLADSPTDRERLERGLAFFDDLYRSFTRQPVRLPVSGPSNDKAR